MAKITIIISLILGLQLCYSYLGRIKSHPINYRNTAQHSKFQTLFMHGTETTSVSNQPSQQEYSFVNDDLRKFAMKLHTRDQAPKEGQQQAQVPFIKWEPTRMNYLQFLVDSLHVYETLDSIVNEYPSLSLFRSTGLERSAALKTDIAWICKYDPNLTIPQCGEAGLAYAELLKRIVKESIPKFMCHYYNQYFAHTAGGRMIGKRMSDLLLGGEVLSFYKWEGEVKELLDGVRRNIDTIAESWSEVEKKECCEETMACFRYGGGLMSR